MNEEPEYSREQFVPSPRDVLFHRARIGEITPKEAEAEAARMGWKPLASHPPDDEFDPRGKSRWTLSMALAWILWRDFREVREWDNDYRAKCWNWHPCKTRLTVDGGASTRLVKGYAVYQPEPANLLLFLIRGAASVQTQSRHPPGGSTDSAKIELWNALADERLTAEGIPAAGGARINVPAREWVDLEPVSNSILSEDCFRYRHLPHGRAYSDIVWRRDDLTRLWPEVSGLPHGGNARPPRRAGTPSDEAAFVKWVDDRIASGAAPPTREEAEHWADGRNIGVTWARKQHTALPDDKKLAKGETPTRWLANRQ